MHMTAWDGQSIAIYGACFCTSLLFMGMAQTFDIRVGKRSQPFILFFLVALAIPVLLAGLRWQVGTDFGNYQSLYKLINSFTMLEEFSNQSGRTEWGYMLLNVLAFRVFQSEQMVFFLSSLLIYGLFFLGFWKEHETGSIMLSLYIFYMCFFPQSMNIIRQYLAMGVLFLAQRYIWQRKPVRFCIGVVLASLFHNTALLFLPFYFAYGETRERKWIRWGILMGLLVLLGAFSVGSSVTGSLMSLLGEENLEITSGAMGMGIFLKRIPLLAVIAWRYRAMVQRDQRCKLWVFFYVVSILLYQFGYFYIVFNRVALFFETSLLYLLPHSIRSIPGRGERLMTGIALVLYLGIWGIQSMVMDNLGGCMPYQWIMGDM